MPVGYNDLGFLTVKKDYEKKAGMISFLIGDIISKSSTILDVGSGNGLIVGYLEKWHNKKIFKIDPLGTAPDIVKQDFLKNNFKDKEFELIILNGVSDYIEDKERLFQELSRVGKIVYTSFAPKYFYSDIVVDKWSKFKETEKEFLKRCDKYFKAVDITHKAVGSKFIYTILKPIVTSRKYLLYSI